mgnify:CR=1 FL=1
MEKKESIKEYLQKMLDRWNKYDVLDGFVAESFRVDLEKTLEYWDLRIADNKEELDKAREEGRESIIAELSISESMERVEGFFREAPVDYDDKCNLWNDFLSKLKQ